MQSIPSSSSSSSFKFSSSSSSSSSSGSAMSGSASELSSNSSVSSSSSTSVSPGMVTTATIGEDVRKLLSTMEHGTIRDAVARGDADTVTVYGKMLKYLTVPTIKNCLAIALKSLDTLAHECDSSEQQYKTTLALLDIYTELMHAISEKDFASIAFPFLLYRPVIALVIDSGASPSALVEKYRKLWAFVEDKDLEQFYISDTDSIYGKKEYLWTINDVGLQLIGLLESGDADSIRDIGSLFDAMGMSDESSFFEQWVVVGEYPSGYVKFFLDILKAGNEAAIDAYVELISNSPNPKKDDYLRYIAAAKSQYRLFCLTASLPATADDYAHKEKKSSKS